MVLELNKAIKGMEIEDLLTKLATKSHVLLFLTDIKEIEAVTNEINVIRYEIKARGQKIGASKEIVKRRY